MRWANKYPLVPIRSRVTGLLFLAFFLGHAALAADYEVGFGSATSNSKCYLAGSIRPLNAGSNKKGFQSLQNRIRLTFDANDPQTCERYIKSYCFNNILGKGDLPVKLRGYFRPEREIASEADKKPTHNYEITEGCKLVVD